MTQWIVCRKPTSEVGAHSANIIYIVTTKEAIKNAVAIALNVRNNKIYRAELAFMILLRTHKELCYKDAIDYCKTLNRNI